MSAEVIAQNKHDKPEQIFHVNDAWLKEHGIGTIYQQAEPICTLNGNQLDVSLNGQIITDSSGNPVGPFYFTGGLTFVSNLDIDAGYYTSDELCREIVRLVSKNPMPDIFPQVTNTPDSVVAVPTVQQPYPTTATYNEPSAVVAQPLIQPQYYQNTEPLKVDSNETTSTVPVKFPIVPVCGTLSVTAAVVIASVVTSRRKDPRYQRSESKSKQSAPLGRGWGGNNETVEVPEDTIATIDRPGKPFEELTDEEKNSLARLSMEGTDVTNAITIAIGQISQSEKLLGRPRGGRHVGRRLPARADLQQIINTYQESKGRNERRRDVIVRSLLKSKHDERFGSITDIWNDVKKKMKFFEEYGQEKPDEFKPFE